MITSEVKVWWHLLEEGDKWGMCVSDLYDGSRLVPLLHHMHFGSAVPLIIPDVDGDLGGLQPLETVTLTAAPLIDVLQEGRTRERRFKDVKALTISRKL